ncbi:Hypothetical protein NocV09_00600400 [Nannochloropsis oceanica]
MPSLSSISVIEERPPALPQVHDPPQRHLILTHSPISTEVRHVPEGNDTTNTGEAGVDISKGGEEAMPPLLTPQPFLSKRPRHRIRNLASFTDVASIYIPSFRFISSQGSGSSGGGHVIYDILVKPAGRFDAWTIHRYILIPSFPPSRPLLVVTPYNCLSNMALSTPH